MVTQEGRTYQIEFGLQFFRQFDVTCKIEPSADKVLRRQSGGAQDATDIVKCKFGLLQQAISNPSVDICADLARNIKKTLYGR